VPAEQLAQLDAPALGAWVPGEHGSSALLRVSQK
jgi:hypothetical protein